MKFTNLPGFFDPDNLNNRLDGMMDHVMPVLEWFERWHASEVRGIDGIPTGPALFVGNHSASTLSIDTFLFAAALYRARGMRDIPFGLAHDVAVDFPIFNQLLGAIGGVRASHDNARRLFERGSKVMVYPGGDVDSMRPWVDRDRVLFDGRRGYIRLALRHNVPIVPVVSCGTQETLFVFTRGDRVARWLRTDKLIRLKVMPLMFTVPWGFTLGPPPPFFPLPARILIDVLEPIRFDRHGEAACSDEGYVAQCAQEVETRMQAALTALSERRRQRGSRYVWR